MHGRLAHRNRCTFAFVNRHEIGRRTADVVELPDSLAFYDIAIPAVVAAEIQLGRCRFLDRL